MARRTKEDAMATRDSILDAAELLFAKQGVSRTTLQHIATAAGVTRGAIYWHFVDKAALFNAMMERAIMPLETAMQSDASIDPADPLADFRERLLTAFHLTVHDPRARRVFEIATHKIEFVEELRAARDRQLASYEKFLARAEKRIKAGVKHGVLRRDLNSRATALALWATTDGLIRIWLLAPESFDLVKIGQKIIDSQLAPLYVGGSPPSRA